MADSLLFQKAFFFKHLKVNFARKNCIEEECVQTKHKYPNLFVCQFPFSLQHFAFYSSLNFRCLEGECWMV